MKSSFYFLLSLVGLLCFFRSASAHIGGIPFFRINDLLTLNYTVPSISVGAVEIPQDSAPENYFVNQPIHFEIDTRILQIPPDVARSVEMDWDFGDGSPQASGLTNTHTYAKPGSYILSIRGGSTFAVGGQPQVIESVLMNILPSEGYGLPRASFSINGKTISDPVNDPAFSFAPGSSLTFDASASTAPSGHIAEYAWNFGDGTTGSGQRVQHTYPADQPIAAPLLRVKDSSGFIADNYAQISFSSDNTRAPSPAAAPAVPLRSNLAKWALGLGLIVIAGIAFAVARRRA
jgi:hypothetical protein